MIWVIKHTLPNGDELWWRPNRCGYTSELVAAGRYTEEEAKSQERSRFSDRAMPLTQVLAGLERGTVGAAFGMHCYRGGPR